MSNRRKNTMVLCSISILIIMYVLMGCKQQTEVKVKSQFSTSDLLTDYDYLWETLDAEYLFFPVLEEQNIEFVCFQIPIEQELGFKTIGK